MIACVFSSAFQQGVDMNLFDYDGRTALHIAAAEGHLRCVKFLVETCNVRVNLKDRLVLLHSDVILKELSRKPK